MIVIGLDGNEYNWNIRRYCSESTNQSNLHISARTLIKEVYPLDKIAEEVKLPDCNLYIDFVLPNRLLFVEVDGIQHKEFTTFFHESKLDFLQSQKRDKDKEQWARLNNFRIVRLLYNEQRTKWFSRLTEG